MSSANNTSDCFVTGAGFCPQCGTVLPLNKDKGNIDCVTCKSNTTLEAYGNMEVNYTIYFKTEATFERLKGEVDDDDSEDEGPVANRKCPKCGNEEMSYATIQLRSADEGQTVFYTCTKCKFKETENS